MKEFIIKHKTKIIFISILLACIIIRMFFWPTAISQVNCDEAMTAINAKSMAETGCDTYGTSFPVYLEAWGVFGQSVVLMYMMAFFIKLFGFSFVTVRLPMLIVSIISLFVFYDFVKRIFHNKKIALIGFGFLAICPWHIMQSIWSIDCNMFPHFMLFSVYLLYRGITDKKWCLYVSMFFFAITMYTYGVSVYVIPIFLCIAAIYLLRKKQINFKQLLVCIAIYFVFALPIFTMYVINFLGIDTDICIGPMTIQYFDQNTRTSDMLFFSENFGETFVKNIMMLFLTVFVGYDGLEWNASPIFGTIYHVSLIFLIIGLFQLWKNRNQKSKLANEESKINNQSIGIFLFVLWLSISFILGMIINNTNINRLNCIWYPIIFFTIYGIDYVINKKKIFGYMVTILYIVLAISFSIYFYGFYTQKIDMSGCFSRKYIDAVHYASTISSDIIYFNEKNDGALDVYTKFQAFIDKRNIICIKTKDELLEQLQYLNQDDVVIIHKEYIQNEMVFDVLDISYLNQTSFQDYIVLSNPIN